MSTSNVLFYDTRGRSDWCREHHKVCFVSDGKHRSAFLWVLPR